MGDFSSAVRPLLMWLKSHDIELTRIELGVPSKIKWHEITTILRAEMPPDGSYTCEPLRPNSVHGIPFDFKVKP